MPCIKKRKTVEPNLKVDDNLLLNLFLKELPNGALAKHQYVSLLLFSKKYIQKNVFLVLDVKITMPLPFLHHNHQRLVLRIMNHVLHCYKI